MGRQRPETAHDGPDADTAGGEEEEASSLERAGEDVEESIERRPH
ncbi:hypothetical protein [Georgenia satyanarayanai]|nr:hypothetical protein [Georgenia satyanarayanai]